MSTVSDPSWSAILVAWVTFVLGPLAAMVVVAHPRFGVGVASGIVLSVAAGRTWRARRRTGQADVTPAPRPLAADGGPSDDAAASMPDGERS